MDSDEYDLGAVEAELARMQQRRAHRISARRSSAADETAYITPVAQGAAAAVSTTPVAADFDLNEAELSPDTESDFDGDSDLHSSLSHRSPRRRDSLDLSMSVADVPIAPLLSARVHSTTRSTKSVGRAPAHEKQRLSSLQQRHERCDERHAKLKILTRPTQTSDVLDSDCIAFDNNDSQRDFQRASSASTGAPLLHTHSDDSWTSDLVRRRRKLEKDANAATKGDRAVNATNTTRRQSAHMPPPPTIPVDSKHSSQSTRTRHSPQRTHSLDNAHSLASLPSTPAIPPPQAQRNNNHQHQQHQRTAVPAQTAAHAAMPSSLRPPERYTTTASGARLAPMRTTASSTASKSTAASTEPQASAHTTTFSSYSSSSETAGAAIHTASNKTFSAPTEPQMDDDNNNNSDDLDDIDAVCAEEERLRQSLAKLDSRLTKLSTATTRSHAHQQQQEQQQEQRSNRPATTSNRRHSNASSDRRSAHRNSATTAAAAAAVMAADSADNSVIAAASYGGGAHCKSGQLTSAFERASLARRAEMSSGGMHKLRVRTGGASLSQDINASSSSDSKHKVVVKRDLAHLLF